MFGSHTKSFHPGRAAQNGLLAAMLAQNGYESSEEALEAKRGWANVVGSTKDEIPKSLEKWYVLFQLMIVLGFRIPDTLFVIDGVTLPEKMY